MANQFHVGQSVRHVLAAPDSSNAVVRAIIPPHRCGEWGVGNWLDGAYAPQAVLVVEYPNRKTAREFASYYQSL